jgi:surface polysaccharide O-acyltransferase-like enzyme
MRNRWFKLCALLQWLLAPLPGLLLLALFAMSLRATQLIGKMPEPSRDDPAQIGINDALYQMLYQVVGHLVEGTFYSLLLWLPVTIATLVLSYRDWSRRRSIRSLLWYGFLPIMLYLVAILLVLLEPTNRLGWYFD